MWWGHAELTAINSRTVVVVVVVVVAVVVAVVVVVIVVISNQPIAIIKSVVTGQVSLS